MEYAIRVLKNRIILLSIFVFALVSVSLPVEAQVVHEELQETVPAIVVSIEREWERDIVGTEATALVQEVRAEVQGGLRNGQTVTFENDIATLTPGDNIFLNRLVSIDGVEYFELKDFDRRGALVMLTLLFLALIVFVARFQGLRAFLSLSLSILAIVFVLVPALLKGYNPVLTSLFVAGIILAVVIFLTHGFKARTVIAFLGTMGAVLVTAALAHFWVSFTNLTGFGSDASIYLNISTRGALDFAGLLLGGIIIGVLGVLDDVSVTQASVVQELKRANESLGLYELYQRALRVGRDHIGSLVNTLALAYIGVSLPLVLLLSRNSGSGADLIVNQEIVAAEIVRIMVSSIGLLLAVPLTTLVAAWWFSNHPVSEAENSAHTH